MAPDDNIRARSREYFRDRDDGSSSNITRNRRDDFSSQFTGRAGPSRRLHFRATPYSASQMEPAIWGQAEEARLSISNLHSGVTAQDLEILFSELGELKDYSVHYNKIGSSLGTGEVVFKRKADAVAARNRYNGVKLDGKPMIIGFVGVNVMSSYDPSPVAVGEAHADSDILLGSKYGKRARECAGEQGPNHDGKGANVVQENQGKRVRRVVTVEELDADLDNWRKSASGRSRQTIGGKQVE